MYKEKKLGETNFLFSNIKLAFTKLRQVFIIILILFYLDLKYSTNMKTNNFCYAGNRIISDLTLYYLDQ